MRFKEQKKSDDEHMYSARIGKQVRQARLSANLTQVEVAVRAETSQSAISELESGHGCTVWLLRRVAQVMGYDFKIVLEKRYEA